MAGLLVNLGEVRMLSLLTNDGQALENNVLRLYQNDKTPAETDTAGDYTQATFTGYVAITLTATDWTITSGAPSDATALEKTFSSTADQALQNIYGYYLVTAVGGELVAAERFTGAPFAIQFNGDQIKVTTKITQD